MATGRHHSHPVSSASRPYPQYPEEPSPPYSTVDASGYTMNQDIFDIPPPKRQRLSSSIPSPVEERRPSLPSSARATPAPAPVEKRMSTSSMAGPKLAGAAGASSTPTKSKRVRTGCLTCRERHLKCDEAQPTCMNCHKSNRECKRGVRLNFLDVQVKPIPFAMTPVDWVVTFQDESRIIASEYRGGLQRYAPFDQIAMTPPHEPDLDRALRQHRPMHSDPASATGGGMVVDGGGKPRPVPYFGAGGHPMQSDPVHDDPQLAHLRSSISVSGGGGNFTLAAIQDKFSLKTEDAGPRTHHYRTSDVSSVASSMVPQGVGPPSNASFRTASAAGQHAQPDDLMTPPSEKANGEREYLSSAEEIRYMQVFVEEVGVWMDSLDKEKHFSRIIPYLALKSPMLLNAFLACGVKHLTLVNRAKDDKALFYYDTATTQLLRSLQNPDRNTAECATTAVVLNVYEIMSEKPNERMSHIAGARALIRECGWNAQSTGIGKACFWLNIGMELLSCLSFNWQTAWDPDQWKLDTGFLQNMATDEGNGPSLDASTGHGRRGVDPGEDEDEVWIHRIFYIVAKIANFRAKIPKFRDPDPRDEAVRSQTRFTEWNRLKGLCDKWNECCPSAMRPFGYVTEQQGDNSAFPNVWLIKRAGVIGRLFYHTAMVLLHQINPLEQKDANESNKYHNQRHQNHHARQVCGIVAHTKDRGVASVAIRSLAISAAVLRERREQEEVLAILHKIQATSGWRLEKIVDELSRTWGWDRSAGSGTNTPATAVSTSSGLGGPPQQMQQQQQQLQHLQQQQAPPPPPPPAPSFSAQFLPAHTHAHTTPPISAAPVFTPLTMPRPQMARVNPLLVNADFSQENHPYSNFYAPPNRTNASNSSQGFWTGL